MSETRWTNLIAAQAMNEIFSKNHFDITLVDSLCRVVGKEARCKLRDELATLHCVDYARMPREIRAMLPAKVAELVGLAYEIGGMQADVSRTIGLNQEDRPPMPNLLGAVSYTPRLNFRR